MKILEHAVVMEASRYEYQHHVRQESVTYSERVKNEDNKKALSSEQRQEKIREIREENKRAVQKDHYSSSKSIENFNAELDKEDEPFIGTLKMRIMKQVLEEFTGQKVEVYKDPKDSQKDIENRDDGSDNIETTAPIREFTLEYELYETHHEKEAVAFSAVGNVTTEKGGNISFATTLRMSREFYSENYEKKTTTGELVDPLVINLDGKGVELTGKTVEFDLDGDGENETIHNISAGSGFLALDRNGDGKINDGSELFGPQSGHGFGELAGLDSDGNGWIDESDALFYDLKIWRPGDDNSGENLLASDVGAIYLNSVKGEFSLKDSSNNLNGVVREHGMFLHESNGEAGFVQEIDLTA